MSGESGEINDVARAEPIVVALGKGDNETPIGPHGHPAPTTDAGKIYPTCFKEETWFAWKLERASDDAKPRKIPRAPWQYPDHVDRYVGHDDETAWEDIDTVREWTSKLPGYEIANRVPDLEADEPRPAFFDFDDVRDPETGEIHPEAWEFIQTHDLPAWFSSSGTGIHAFARVEEIPAEYKPDVEIELPEWEHTDDPELELYTNAHFCALTGEHISGTPIDSPDITEIVGRMLRERGEKKHERRATFDPDADPEKTRAELADVDTTDEIGDVFDAVRHTHPRDIRLRSTVTEERADGSKSLDPSWVNSGSGTRLAQVDDGWVYRKRNIGLDALQVVALEERIIHRPGEYPSGEDFWRAVDALRSRGAHIPEYESPDGGRGEPVAIVPFKRIAQLNDDDAKQLLESHGIEWPATADARERLRNRLLQAFRAGEKVALDAPTGLGKSHAVASEPWLYRTNITGDAPVIHLSPTKDARDENVEKSRKAGVSFDVLKGRKDRCPVARGDHDPNPDGENPDVVLTINGEPASVWIDRQCDEKANPFQLAHAYAAECNDQGETLPCCEGESDCAAMTQWDGVPRDDDGNPAADVVHATHTFAYVPGLRHHTNLVIDEAPGAFTVELTQDRIRRAVNAYLDTINAPVKTYEGLVTLATSEGYGGDLGNERDALEGMLGETPEREWYVEHPDAHALAPDLTRAIYQALRWEEPDANGRRSTRVLHEPPRFDADDQGEGFGGNLLSVVVDRENTVRTIRHTPDFSVTRSVVGLDAHPCEPLWQQSVGARMSVDRVLTPDERRLWRRFERGLTVVQVGDATRPLSGASAAEWFGNDWKLDVLLRSLRERYGREFQTAITAAAAEPAMRTRMQEAGVSDPETMHYGEETSRNDFAGESVGLINGCIDPGDGYVLDFLAELELDATPERADPADRDDPTTALCPACGGRRCSECNDTGLKRARGRGFSGSDADTAEEFLASVRENHVAQAAGRYARNADDPTDTATVYVRTDAIPDGFADVKVNGVEWVASDLQREIVHGLVTRDDGATAKGLAEDAECGRSHVRKTLTRLEEQGIIEREPGAGPNPDLWYASMDTLAGVEHVDLLAERGDTTPSLNAAGNGGKARTATYEDSIRDCPSFSPEIGSVSQPGELALTSEEITAQVLGGEELGPPG